MIRDRLDSITVRPDGPPAVLVAEDNADIRALLSMLLTDEGYLCVEAADGQDALDLAVDRDVDLILLDINMPRLTGTEFCHAYRERGGQAAVILITAAVEGDVAAAAEACGAVGHICKPFDIMRVLEMVKRHVRRPLGRAA